jgi:four helix bundle protein
LEMCGDEFPAFFVAEARRPYEVSGPSNGVRRFEDFKVWQKARALTSAVYKATRARTFADDRACADQMRRAALSIGSNIAEGFERGTPAQFRQSLYISRGSCGELRSQLYSALDNAQIDEQTFRALSEAAEEISRMLWGLIGHIEQKLR